MIDEKQKEVLLSLWKNIGLIIISGGIIYWLGPTWNQFINSAIIDQSFYVLFAVVIVYSTATIVRKLIKPNGIIKGKLSKQQTENVIVNNNSAQHIFQEFGDLEGDIKVNPADTGKQMLIQVHGKIEDFNKRLDKETHSLEKQFDEMTKLRKDINHNVGNMYIEYKRLEQQMHVTSNMIRTKKLLGEKLKQIKGN